MTPPSLKERVLFAAQGHDVPTRTVEQARQRLVLTGLAVGTALATWATLSLEGGIGHAAGRPLQSSLWVVGGTLVLAAVATWLALPAGRSMLPRSRGLLLTVMVAVPLLVGLWLLLWHATYADPFERTGTRCFSRAMFVAPWPFAILTALRGRLDPVQPALSGGALGAAAGAWSAVTVELWCPLARPDHVVFGHVAPLVTLVILGAWVGHWLFRVPRSGRLPRPTRAG